MQINNSMLTGTIGRQLIRTKRNVFMKITKYSTFQVKLNQKAAFCIFKFENLA